MKFKRKAIEQQVVVLTGASSGIGLCTARMLARKGATVVLAARNRDALASIVEEIRQEGGRAAFVVADVADMEQVDAIAQTAIELFGGFDSWANIAGVGAYGRLDELQMEDKRRLFDINFWGVVNGCRAAVRHLRDRGGALINIGSATSEVAIPLLGIYSASKHAVKAYTDTLRMELEASDVPISVTLLMPASIDTPFFEHSLTAMGVEPLPMQPVYDPEIVAEAIVHACEHPVRNLFIGGAARAMAAGEYHMPRFTEKVLERTAFEGQMSDEPARNPHGNLYHPLSDGRERGTRYEGHVMESSAYTKSRLHPVLAGLALAGIGAAVVAGVNALRARRSGQVELPRSPSPSPSPSRGDVASGDAAEVDLLIVETYTTVGDAGNALDRENLG